MHESIKRSELLDNSRKIQIRSRKRFSKNKTPADWPGRQHLIEELNAILFASGYFEILGRCLASIFNQIVFDRLVLIESAKSGALDCRYVNEHVLVSNLRLDESIALGWVKPFDGAFCHVCLLRPSSRIKKARSRCSRATPLAGF
jgi:hypothetical protein